MDNENVEGFPDPVRKATFVEGAYIMNALFKLLKLFGYIIAYFSIFGLWFYLVFHISRRVTRVKEHIIFDGVRKKEKHKFTLSSFLWDFPWQVGKDVARTDPNCFGYKGIVVFTGEQGAGKSIAMIQFARSMKEQYPQAYVLSNTPVSFQDEYYTSPDPIFERKNGDKGIIVILDECQNYFNSKMSKDMPPELLATVTQNRKNRRILLMTSQSFYMLAKDIRTMTNTGEIRSCHTFFGALTVVIRKHPTFDNEGNLIKSRFLGMYAFVHDDDLRNCYDTLATVENLYKSGFKPKEERYSSYSNHNTYTNNYYVNNNKNRRFR